jgi:hypothetical protein
MIQIKTITRLACLAAAGLLAGQAYAHTRLQTATATEGQRVYNSAAIGHGCEGANSNSPMFPVIANSIVFPDGTDSLVSFMESVDQDNNPETPDVIKAVPQAGRKTSEFITWGGQISQVMSKDIFAKSQIKYSRKGFAGQNPVGVQSWSGSLPGDKVVGLVPLRINAAALKTGYNTTTGEIEGDDSCVNSVTFRVAIADICKITNIAGFNAHTVNLWMPGVGSKFDGRGLEGYNSPATFKITRDVEKYPFQPGCFEHINGIDVQIDPSAAQLNNDMPIKGVWPK